MTLLRTRILDVEAPHGLESRPRVLGSPQCSASLCLTGRGSCFALLESRRKRFDYNPKFAEHLAWHGPSPFGLPADAPPSQPWRRRPYSSATIWMRLLTGVFLHMRPKPPRAAGAYALPQRRPAVRRGDAASRREAERQRVACGLAGSWRLTPAGAWGRLGLVKDLPVSAVARGGAGQA